MTKKRKRMVRVLQALCVGLLVCVSVLAGALYVVLVTESGRAWLLRTAETVIEDRSPFSIQFGTLSGRFPVDFTLDRLTVGDKDGEWLAVDALAVAWSPRALLGRQIHVRHVTAEYVLLSRLPEGTEKEPEPLTLPELPASLPRIVIERLAIDRLELALAESPEIPVVTIEGKVSPLAEGATGLHARLDIVTLEGDPVEGNLDVALDTERRTLALDVRYSESTPIFIGPHLGSPVVVRAHGEGPLADWSGALSIIVNDADMAQLALGLREHEGLTLTINGPVYPPEKLIPEAYRSLLSDGVETDLIAHVTADRTLRFERAHLALAWAQVDADGAFDPDAETLLAAVRVTIPDLAPLESLAGRPLHGSTTIEAHVEGTIDAPQGRIHIAGSDLTADEMGIDALTASFSLSPMESTFQSGFPNLIITGEGALEGIRLPTEEPLPADRATWTIEAALPADEPWVLDLLEIDGPDLRVTADGRYAHDSGDMALTLRGDVAVLAPYMTLAGMTMDGGLGLELRSEGNVQRREASYDLAVRAENLTGLPEGMAPIIGAMPILQSQGRITDGSRIDLDRLSLEVAAGQFQASGWTVLEEETFEASWEASLPELGIFADLAQRTLSGRADASGHVTGSFDEARIEMSVMTEQLYVEDLPLSRVSVTLGAEGGREGAVGELGLSVWSEEDRLDASSVFEVDETRVSLAPFRMSAPGITLDGDLRYAVNDKLATGSVALDASDLAWIGNLVGHSLEGQVTGQVRAMAPAGMQNVEADLTVRNLRHEMADLEEGLLTAVIEDLLGEAVGDIALTLTNLRREEIVLADTQIRVDGSLESGRFQIASDGTVPQPVTLRANGRWNQENEGIEAQLDGLNAEWDSVLPLTLDGPLRVRTENGAIEVDPFRFTVASGEFAGRGIYSTDLIDASLTLTGFPLSAIPVGEGLELDGEAAGAFRLMGSPAAPEFDVEVTLTGVTQGPQFPGVDLRADGRYGQGSFTGDLAVSGLFDNPTTVEWGLPARLQLRPFVAELPSDEPLSARVAFDGDLETLATLAMVDGQSIRGGLMGNLEVSGFYDQPHFLGEVRIVDGSYESFTMGTALQGINVLLEGDGARLELRQAEAHDTRQGALQATGWVELLPEDQFPFEFVIELSQARLINRDDLIAALSGDLLVSGSLERIQVGGDVRVGPAEIFIPEPRPQMMAGLHVVEVDGSPDRIYEAPPVTPSTIIERTFLALNVNVPNQVFVRGPGLESEWGGTLRITGPALDPEVAGGLNIIRGSVELLGRSFDLTSGTVTLDGAFPPQPIIDLRAQTRAEDIDAIVVVRGTTTALTLELTSNPPQPQDEVLARLLFGKSAAGISPMQAVQLAQTAAALSQGLGSPTLMDRTRRALGVDQLDLTQSDEGFRDTTVGVGKYLTDDIYVWAEHGMGEESGRVRIELEITDTLSVESSAAQDGKGNIGVFWKRDY